MSDQLKIPVLYGDVCEMCTCADRCEVCAFDEDNIKAQAERIEKLEWLVKTVDYCPNLCGIDSVFIDEKSWLDYRDEVLK